MLADGLAADIGTARAIMREPGSWPHAPSGPDADEGDAGIEWF